MNTKAFEGKINRVGRGRIVVWMVALTFLICALFPALMGGPSYSKGRETACEFSLSNPDGEGGIEVRIRFNAQPNQEIFLAAPWLERGKNAHGSTLHVDFDVDKCPEGEYSLRVDPPGVLRIITGEKSRVHIGYRVSIRSDNQGNSNKSFVSEENLLVTGKAYALASGSSLFFIPRKPNGKALFKSYRINFADLGPGMTSAAPYKESGKHTYFCPSVNDLQENYIAWGKIETLECKEKGKVRIGYPYASAAFSNSRYKGKLEKLIEMIRALFSEAKAVLPSEAENREFCAFILPDITMEEKSERVFSKGNSIAVILFDEKKLGKIWSLGTAIFKTLASGSFMSSASSDALWFIEGATRLYGLIAAVRAGLSSSGEADELLSEVYARYVSNPLRRKITLINRMKTPQQLSFFSDKSVMVLASIASRMRAETGKKSDLDALVRDLGMRLSGDREGRLSIVDIEESAENLTGISWTRYLDRLVRKTSLIRASEFAKSEIFAQSAGLSSTGKTRLLTKGSGRGWLFLLISLLMILLIPVIFGYYVRRAVRLDLSMPPILPRDEDEEIQ